MRKMRLKLWSFSTTVRNPYRIVDFLKVLKSLEGKPWNYETQKQFQILLIQKRLYGYNPEQGFNRQFLNNLPEKLSNIFTDLSRQLTFEEAKQIFEAKNFEDPPMRGRTSFKPLEKLGLAVIEDGKVKITPLGNYLLSEKFELSEFFLKSLIRWQYPNPLSRDFKDPTIYNIKPFIGTLHLIYRVNQAEEKRGNKPKGISFEEFEIFVLSLIHYQLIDKKVEDILNFRTHLNKLNQRERHKFIYEFKETYLKDFVNRQNSRDYADNAIRYFRLTKFLRLRGGGFYIDLEPSRKIEIEKLLQWDDASAQKFKTKLAYVEYISEANFKLPWETDTELFQIAVNLIQQINNLESELNIPKTKYAIPNQNLKSFINELRLRRQRLLYEKEKIKLSQIQEIERVINELKNIRKLNEKPSIALERLAAEAMQIINDALEIKPNYLAGDDNKPIFTAPANLPDIECYYESFNSIVEVTMLTTKEQWFNEGQPVMRHLREFEEKSKNKETYCIFIAPKIHPDTRNTFWFSVKYEYEGKPQKIIPLTISQLIEILETILEIRKRDKMISHTQFKQLLDKAIEVKNLQNSKQWEKQISEIIKNWQKTILQ